MSYLTIDQLPELKKAYVYAKRMKQETFEFEGETILTSYAKYAVEYLEMRKNERDKKV